LTLGRARVFFDIEIQGHKEGRITFELVSYTHMGEVLNSDCVVTPVLPLQHGHFNNKKHL